MLKRVQSLTTLTAPVYNARPTPRQGMRLHWNPKLRESIEKGTVGCTRGWNSEVHELNKGCAHNTTPESIRSSGDGRTATPLSSTAGEIFAPHKIVAMLISKPCVANSLPTQILLKGIWVIEELYNGTPLYRLPDPKLP